MAEEMQSSLRLFYSADIAGSTAFKNKRQDRSDGRPFWLTLYEGFFEDFGMAVAENWSKENGASESPQVWKLAGDEMLLSQSILDVEDVPRSLRAFRSALVSYQAKIREKFDRSLGLKGTAWCAGFPVINSMIEIARPGAEAGAHVVVDFIGPSIDTGFRLTRFASPARMVISHDLAWLLSKVAAEKREACPFWIYYDGDVALKGVFGGQTYPLFTIDIGDPLEDSRNRLAGREACKNDLISEYVEAFVDSIGNPNLATLPYLASPRMTWGDLPENHRSELRKMAEREGWLGKPEPKDGTSELPPQPISL